MGKGHLFDIRVIAEGERDNVTFCVDPDPRIECKPQQVNNGQVETCRLVFNKWTAKMKKKDHFLIQYILIDRTGLNLRFPDNIHEAFWVHPADKENPVCPEQACNAEMLAQVSQEVKALAVIGDDTLLVLNKDSNVEWYSFVLNFIGDDGSTARWDPIKDNQNGGGGGTP